MIRCCTQEDPIGLAGGLNLHGFASGDPVNFSDPFGLDPCKSSSAWTECLAQALANWGARRGGALGGVALNLGAAANAGMEAAGVNLAASAGDAIGSGRVGEGTLAAAFVFAPGIGRGLRGASAGLRNLFAASGGLADNTLIGIRSALLADGFTMSASRSGRGYLFRNAAGEEVRMMRGDNGWYMRAKNAAGNYVDDAGNPAGRAATHIPVANQ